MLLTRRDLQELARKRLREARLLLRGGQYDGAYYLTGLAVECALKACIAHQTRRHDFPDKELVVESYSHDLTKLLKMAGLEIALNRESAAHPVFANNWNVVKDWKIKSRYMANGQQKARDLYTAVAGSAARSNDLDKTALVERDLDAGRRITEALDRFEIPVRGSLWLYDSEASECWFVVATPLVDAKGPKAAYASIQKALKDIDPPVDLPFRKVSVVSPDDPLIKLFRIAIRTGRGISGIRFTHNTINNVLIEDAYIYRMQ